jgi:hypothetical protein
VVFSSRNTKHSGSSAGWRRTKAWQASATSARCCSAACRLFLRVMVWVARSLRGGPTNSDAVPRDQCAADFLQRKVRLMGDQPQHGFSTPTQARAMIAAHGAGLNMTLGLQRLRPPDRRAVADPKPVRSWPSGRTARCRTGDTSPKILGIGNCHGRHLAVHHGSACS